ncbi:MAG: penicillin-binding transpeptidase domain-containing protein, partial [Rhodothermales bacterium]
HDLNPISGYNLHLGLDAGVQALAESLFVGKRGGAVALDVNTGAIISMVSMPDYDPGLFAESVDRATWQYLTNSPEKPLYNRATMNLLPPGSTWKPFMALMSLQEGTITVDETFNCRGYHPFGGPGLFRDMHVHGRIAVGTAIEKSCNTFFFETMMRTDVDTFSKYAHLFGFGERAPTDIDQQSTGLIPDSSYYDRVYPRGWTAGYSINLGIGQGDMGVTPLQLARYVAAIANKGRLLPPHLVTKLEHPETGDVVYPTLPESKKLPIDEEHFEVVRDGMRRVMESGTGYWIQIPGVASGGKTGTAQSPGGRRDDSVFIMFAPYDDPRIAIAVQVENAGYGATAAGPIGSFMAEQYLTGKISDSPQRQARLNAVLNVRSQPLATNEEDDS